MPICVAVVVVNFFYCLTRCFRCLNLKYSALWGTRAGCVCVKVFFGGWDGGQKRTGSVVKLDLDLAAIIFGLPLDRQGLPVVSLSRSLC